MMSILERLRADTADAHQRIEQVMDFNRATFSLTDLHSMLLAFHGFHAQWEPRAAAYFSDRAQWFDGRRKLQSLRRDLKFFGMSDAEIDRSPTCTALPDMTDRITAMGPMYVMEGSTLGGQWVRRMLEKRFGLTEGNGYSYFLSYGDQVGVMWRSFCADLIAAVPEGASTDGDRLVTTARQTFERLTEWLVTCKHDATSEKAAS